MEEWWGSGFVDGERSYINKDWEINKIKQSRTLDIQEFKTTSKPLSEMWSGSGMDWIKYMNGTNYNVAHKQQEVLFVNDPKIASFFSMVINFLLVFLVDWSWVTLWLTVWLAVSRVDWLHTYFLLAKYITPRYMWIRFMSSSTLTLPDNGKMLWLIQTTFVLWRKKVLSWCCSSQKNNSLYSREPEVKIKQTN